MPAQSNFAFLSPISLSSVNPHLTPRSSYTCHHSLIPISASTSAPASPKLRPTPVVTRQPTTPPLYRLYIYNDPFNKRERVVDILLKTCQELSFSRAYSAMQEAHENGRGLVLVVCQEIAEHYCSVINQKGVISTIEPDN